MGTSKDLMINISANAVQASAALTKITTQLDTITKAPKSATGGVLQFLIWEQAASVAFNAIRKVAQSVGELIDLYAKQERAEVKLAATIKATGNVIGMSVTELVDMAGGLQSVTRFGDETILGMQQLFIATQKLTREQLPVATELALDMAEAMGTDATQAAQVLAKALADPIKGMESLRDKNIHFTQSERDKIKELQESNRLQEAQQIMLDKVAQTYGGIARAVGETDTAKIDQIKNLIGDIKEGLGESLVGALRPAFEWLLERLNEVNKRINDMRDSRELLDMYHAGGASAVGKHFSPEAIQKQLDETLGEQTRLEDLLKRAYAVKKGVMPDSQRAAMWITEPESFWDNMVVGGSNYSTIYKQWKGTQEVSRQLAAAKLISQTNTVEVPGLESTGGGGPTSEQQTATERILELTTNTEAAQRKVLEARILELNVLRSQVDEMMTVGTITQEEGIAFKELIRQQRAADQEKLDGLGKEKSAIETVNDYVQKNASLSITAQQLAIDANIAQAETWLALEQEGSAYAIILQQIIDKLREQKGLLTGPAATAKKELDYSSVSSLFGDLMGMADAFASLEDQLYQNQIDALQTALDEQRDMWRDYYDDIKQQHKNERDQLDAQYQWGRISAEQYFASIAALNDKKTQAEQEAADREEELLERMDELKRRQFESGKANSIAQAFVSGALGIANIWKDWASNPIVAGIFTGITTAAVGAQIGTIASQQYVPMAEGGLVTGPMHALIGEAGPELVTPLKDLPGGSIGGQIVINVNVEHAYTGDDLTESVYRGIERAQRTGKLPLWRTAV